MRIRCKPFSSWLMGAKSADSFLGWWLSPRLSAKSRDNTAEYRSSDGGVDSASAPTSTTSPFDLCLTAAPSTSQNEFS